MQGLEELIRNEVKQAFENSNYILRDEVLFLEEGKEFKIKKEPSEFIVLYKFQINSKNDNSKIAIECEDEFKTIKNEYFINSRQFNQFIVCHSDTVIKSDFNNTLIKYLRVISI